MGYVIGLIAFVLSIIFSICVVSAHKYVGGVNWISAFFRFGVTLAILAGVILFFWLANGSVDYLIGRG